MRFLSKFNSGSGTTSNGSYRVVDENGNIILVAVNRYQASFSVTRLNALMEEQQQVNVERLRARVLDAWREYCRNNPGAPGVFFKV